MKDNLNLMYEELFPTFIQAKENADKLWDAYKLHSDYLYEFVSQYDKGDFNLTPDYVKAMPEYQELKAKMDRSFKSLQSFNQWYLKHYKKDIQSTRK